MTTRWRRIGVALILAVVSGVLAYGLVRRALPRSAGASQDAPYCYALRGGWVCMDRRADCEERLAREPPAEVTARCKAQETEVLTP